MKNFVLLTAVIGSLCTLTPSFTQAALGRAQKQKRSALSQRIKKACGLSILSLITFSVTSVTALCLSPLSPLRMATKEDRAIASNNIIFLDLLTPNSYGINHIKNSSPLNRQQ